MWIFGVRVSRSFDARRAAELELEWWIVHRERKARSPGDLDCSLADAAAAIYLVPSDRLMEHGRLRAEAMILRDDSAANGGTSDSDWERIHQLLRGSWQSLSRAVRTPT